MRELEPDSFVFTDPHFHHKRLVEMRHRPDGYEAIIAESWQSIPATATIYCLGDVCLGDKVKVHSMYIEAAPGYKILVRGNHDKEKESWYLSHGWDEVHDNLMRATTVNGRHTRLLMSHEPIADNGRFDINVHGHFHNDLHRARKAEVQAIYCAKHKLLALECVGYKLISFQDFLGGRIEQIGLPQVLAENA